MQRALAATGFMVVLAALVILICRGGPQTPPLVPEALLDRISALEDEIHELQQAQAENSKDDLLPVLNSRIADLEREVRTLRRRLASAAVGGHTPQEPRSVLGARSASSGGPGSGSWPLLARKLTVDLWLDEGQRDAVDAALEDCDNAHRSALSETEWSRRDVRSQLARKTAYREVLACLRDKQKSFDEWLEKPGNSEASAWFLKVKPCGGCGKKKSEPEKAPEPAPGARAEQ